MAKQPKTTLIIDDFQVPVKLVDDFVCGGVEDEFRTALMVTTRGLTKEGFVIEVKGLIDAIKEAYLASGQRLKASCEELAGGVLYVVHRAVGERLVNLDVTVENRTGRVQLQWEEGEEIPNFPREATNAEIKRTEEAAATKRQQDDRYRC